MSGSRSRGQRISKPRRGSLVSVEGLNEIHYGKVVAVTVGEALVEWDNGKDSLIDLLDLLRRDGSPFNDS